MGKEIKGLSQRDLLELIKSLNSNVSCVEKFLLSTWFWRGR